jgi:hypothetical protein
MRYEGNRKSSRDPQIEVYSFSMGLDELLLFRAMVIKALRYMPKTIETMPTEGRLRNFMKTIDKIVIKNYGKKPSKIQSRSGIE